MTPLIGALVTPSAEPLGREINDLLRMIHAESDWTATPRVDFYYQAASFARIFNAANDRLDSYSNTNLSVIFEQHDWGLNVQLYVKNVFDKTVVTDQYLTDDTSGLFTNIFLTDPRTYGVSVTKTF